VIRGVLFDLDNTLADFIRMKRLASVEAARAMIAQGADFGVDMDSVGQDLFDHYLATGIESDSAFSEFLQKHNRARLAYGQNATDRVLAAGIEAYLKAKETFLTPYPGVRRTLVALTREGMRLGVLTDAPRLKAWQRLTHLAIAEFFDVVVTSEDTGHVKPSPEPFRAAVDAMGLRPLEVLMVGDWPAKDVRGARELGMKTAYAAYGAHVGTDDGSDHGADFTIQSVDEVLRCVEELRRP
jgi:putative hydrolase of the HAD superfamily